MTLDAAERFTLAGLADVLIPASAGFLSASQADVAGEGLNQVLAARPELGATLKRVLSSATGRNAAEVVYELRTNDPASFAALAEVVAGAYFMNPQVCAAIGYRGQVPRPLDPGPDPLSEELLRSVIGRGRIYRPTPGIE